MFKPANYVSEFVSISVMLLMAIALIAGQANATVDQANVATSELQQTIGDRFNIDFEGQLGDKAVKITIGVITELGANSDLGHFRGEDE